MAQDPDHINSADAAVICGVDRATFNRWAKAGKVPVEFVAPSGRERIFSRSAVEEWASARRQVKVSAA